VINFQRSVFEEDHEELGRLDDEVSIMNNKIRKLEKKNVSNEMLDESLTSLVVSLKGGGREYSQEEKEEFINELDNINVETIQECYDAIKTDLLKRMLSFLPRKYDKYVDMIIITHILKKLVSLSLTLFTTNSTKGECMECESELRQAGGYEILFHCFNTYPELLHKQYIAVVLGRFHSWIPLPSKYMILLVTLREMIGLSMSGEAPECDLDLNDYIVASISISRSNENKDLFFILNFLPVIFDVIDKTTDFVKTNALILLLHLSFIESVDRKDELIDCLLFSRLTPHLIKLIDFLNRSLSNSVGSIEESYECQQLKWLSGTLSNVLLNNLYGCEVFIRCNILLHLLRILEILIPLSSGKVESSNIISIQNNILSSIVYLSFCKNDFPTTFIDYFVKNGASAKIPYLISFHLDHIKKKENGYCNVLLERSMSVLFNVSIEGVINSKKGERNTRCVLYDENVEQLLISVYRLLSTRVVSPPLSSLSLSSFPSIGTSPASSDLYEQLIVKYIPIILINFHKNETCPSSLLPHLSAVHLMMSHSSPESGVDWPRWARLAWDGLINPKDSLTELEKN
jgi:hypothetical protein